MNPHYPLVSARARHSCEYCRAPEIVFNLPFEVEHIIPLARGGETAVAIWRSPAARVIFTKPIVSGPWTS
jgi:5-methylcytosine-specific restriction endonuclease McrA